MEEKITTVSASAKPSLELVWTAFPMRDNPRKAALFWIVLTVVIWAVYWNMIPAFSRGSSILFTIAAGVVLLFSLNSFYLPTQFYVNESGVGFRRWVIGKHLPWTRLRSAVDEREGLFLSPFPVRSRLENFRGLYLLYRDNRESVIAAVAHYKPGLKGLPTLTEPAPVASTVKLEEDEGGW